MHQPTSIVSPEMAFASFDLVSFGSLTIPPHPLRFGFQVDIIPDTSPDHILFALTTQERSRSGLNGTRGFAVRLDLKTGEIWDLLNDSGLIGIMEDSEIFFSKFTDEEPMLMSWEVEHLGNALIPRLHIGGEEWLYPAIKAHDSLTMDTLAGGEGDKGSTMTAFMHPAVWREVL